MFTVEKAVNVTNSNSHKESKVIFAHYILQDSGSEGKQTISVVLKLENDDRVWVINSEGSLRCNCCKYTQFTGYKLSTATGNFHILHGYCMLTNYQSVL